MRGCRVRDQHGEDIGTVKDLLVDEEDNRIRFLKVRVDPTREMIAGAPEYDPRLVRERHDYGNYLDYYGDGAWWGPGYAYPTFPYYR